MLNKCNRKHITEQETKDTAPIHIQEENADFSGIYNEENGSGEFNTDGIYLSKVKRWENLVI